jgi:5,6,7,8-tetrahydromethanopterin hydro-lyase
MGVTFAHDAGRYRANVNTQFGEGSAGSGAEAAHTTTVLGARGGPVEAAWATALAAPSTGFPRIVVNVRPGMPVQPLTLMVPKLALPEPRSFLGAAQAGVAEAVASCVSDGVIDHFDAPHVLLLAAVWLDPAASDEDAVFANQRSATRAALRSGAAGGKPIADVLAAADAGAWNLFFRDPS